MKPDLARGDSMLRRIDQTGIPLLIARIVVGVVFIYMGVNKLSDPVTFLKLTRQYHIVPDSPPIFLNTIAIVLPWLEVITGAALILGLFIRGAAATILLMLVVFTPMILKRALEIQQPGQSFFDIKFDCGCGGGEVVTWQKLLENVGLFLLAGIALLSRSRRFCAELWLARRNPQSAFCHFCGYAAPQTRSGLCESCATPPRLPIGEPVA